MDSYKSAYLKMFNAATDCANALEAAVDDWIRQGENDAAQGGRRLMLCCEKTAAKLRAAQQAAEAIFLAKEG